MPSVVPQQEDKEPRPVPQVTLSIDEARNATGLGRNSIYQAIAAGKLRSVKLGRRRLIRVEDLAAFINSLSA